MKIVKKAKYNHFIIPFDKIIVTARKKINLSLSQVKLHYNLSFLQKPNGVTKHLCLNVNVNNRVNVIMAKGHRYNYNTKDKK